MKYRKRFSTNATVTLRIENRYERYGTIVTTPTVTVPRPPKLANIKATENWEYDYIYAETGTGRTDGESWYFVEIVKSTVRQLVGRKFEFGF